MSGPVVKSHIWRQFVIYVATAELIKNIFKSNRSAKVTMGHWETGAIAEKKQNKEERGTIGEAVGNRL